MRIKSVKLKGFIGIQKGLGLDEISLDFSGLEGLVALEGANGMGKTTLLENLQPYRMLPSRSGTLKSHCFLKDSYKEITFDFAGHEYRCLVKIDALTQRSDEGYIYVDGSKTSVVDSKVSNYDAFIVNLLGSNQLYFSSIFCAQNSRKLSDMKPAELKNLFAEFLRLDRYVKWEETSKTAFRICDTAKENAERQARIVDSKITLLGNPKGDLESALKVIKKNEGDQSLLHKPIRRANQSIERLTKEVAELEVNKKRIADHSKIVASVALERVQEDKGIKDFENTSSNRMLDLNDQLAQQLKVIEDKETIEGAVLEKVSKHAKLDDYQASAVNFSTMIETLGAEASENEKLLYALQRDLDNLPYDPKLVAAEKALSDARTLYGLVDDKLTKVEDDPELVAMRAEISNYEKSAAILNDIAPSCPCPPEVCGLITNSLEAKKALPDLKKTHDAMQRKKISFLQKELLILKTKGIEVKEAVTAHKAEIDKIKETTGEQALKLQTLINNVEIQSKEFVKQRKANFEMIEIIKTELGKLSIITAELPKLQDAEFIAKGIREDVTRIRKAMDDKREAYESAIARLTTQTDQAQEVIDSIKINEYAEADLLTSQADLLKYSDELVDLQAEKIATDKQIVTIREEIKTMEGYRAEIKHFDDKAKHAIAESVDWDLMRVACSKDGMRALEIEAVAPVITANSNDLLSRTFGPNHSVKFDTQDEDGKEVLIIIVIAPDGTETALHKLSGGEKVWILKALRLAQTLISKEKSGRHFETALMDEEDGALSNDNAIKFIRLYRSFLQMAEMQLCFYISHRPEAVAMADSLIEFRPGRINIT